MMGPWRQSTGLVHEPEDAQASEAVSGAIDLSGRVRC